MNWKQAFKIDEGPIQPRVGIRVRRKDNMAVEEFIGKEGTTSQVYDEYFNVTYDNNELNWNSLSYIPNEFEEDFEIIN